MNTVTLICFIGACFIIHRHFTHKENKIIMAALDDLNTALDAIATEVEKISGETTELVAELKELNENPGVDLSGAIAKATAIQAKLQGIDDLVPDAPVTPEEPTV